jgi:hypothetical protein
MSMHRPVFASVFPTAMLALAIASAALAQRIVELDAAGLAAIEHDNPKHARRIDAILTAASRMPCQNDEFARIVHTAYGARDAGCTLELLVSLPPKRVLHFTLDQTRYRAVIAVDNDARAMPAVADTPPRGMPGPRAGSASTGDAGKPPRR